MANLIGQSFGRYHILEQLGMGGMAVVYKAYDDQSGKHVAIKILRSDHLTREAAQKSIRRFEREAKTLSQLSHPNIIKILDFGEIRVHPFLVMEIMPGGSLKQRLPGSPISWREAANYLLPMADALGFAHQRGIVHRDVKPSNILIGTSGRPVLSDFGIVKFLGNAATLDLTTTGIMVGTPEYMSPEQAMGESFDHRVDVYSLGIVFYEMITARKPFVADTPVAVLVKQASEPLPPPSRFVPNLPREVELVLYQALDKNPDARFATMESFRVALENILSNKTDTTVDLGQTPDAMQYEIQEAIPVAVTENPEPPLEIPGYKVVDSPVSSPETMKESSPPIRSAGKSVKGRRIMISLVSLAFLFVLGFAWLQRENLFPLKSPTGVASLQQTMTPVQTNAPDLSSTPRPATILINTVTPLLPTSTPTKIPVSKWLEFAAGISQVSNWKTGMGAKKVGLAWSPSSSKELFISQYQLGTYNISNGQIVETIPCTNSVIEYSRSGSFLMTGGCNRGQSGSVLLWNKLGETSPKVIGSQDDALVDAVLSPSSDIVAVSGDVNNQINLWNSKDGSRILTIQTPYDVQDLDFSPDGNLIASAHRYSIAVLWDTQSGKEIRTLKKSTASGGGVLAMPRLGGGYYGAIAVKFSPDGKQIAVGYRDGTITLWDVSTGEPLYSIQAHKEGVFSLSFTKDGQVLASGGEDTLVKLWKVSDGSLLAERKGHRDMVMDISFSPDDSLLVSSDLSGLVIVWSISAVENQPSFTSTP